MESAGFREFLAEHVGECTVLQNFKEISRQAFSFHYFQIPFKKSFKLQKEQERKMLQAFQFPFKSYLKARKGEKKNKRKSQEASLFLM